MIDNNSFYLSFNSCPFLANHLTLAIPIIAAVLFFFVISCLLQTSFRDPGILPRATPSEAADLERRIGESSDPSPVLALCVPVHLPGSVRPLLWVLVFGFVQGGGKSRVSHCEAWQCLPVVMRGTTSSSGTAGRASERICRAAQVLFAPVQSQLFPRQLI